VGPGEHFSVRRRSAERDDLRRVRGRAERDGALLSPLSTGLFQRAISESGSARPLILDEAERFADGSSGLTQNSSNDVIARLLVAAGRAEDRAAARTAMNKLSATELSEFVRGVSGSSNWTSAPSFWTWSPPNPPSSASVIVFFAMSMTLNTSGYFISYLSYASCQICESFGSRKSAN